MYCSEQKKKARGGRRRTRPWCSSSRPHPFRLERHVGGTGRLSSASCESRCHLQDRAHLLLPIEKSRRSGSL